MVWTSCGVVQNRYVGSDRNSAASRRLDPSYWIRFCFARRVERTIDGVHGRIISLHSGRMNGRIQRENHSSASLCGLP